MARDRPDFNDWLSFSRALARVSTGGHPAGPPPLEREDEETLACLGAAVIAHWSDLPRDLQRTLFDTALAASKELEELAPDVDFRLHLALMLHAHHDRNNDNVLQIFIADLVFDKDGGVTGIANERQLTSGKDVVSWCPFFRPDGKTLIYGTSEMGHGNYEVFEVDIASGQRRRVTEAQGADVLPVFSPDGKWMLWTGQRNDGKVSQLFVGRYRDQSNIAK